MLRTCAEKHNWLADIPELLVTLEYPIYQYGNIILPKRQIVKSANVFCKKLEVALYRVYNDNVVRTFKEQENEMRVFDLHTDTMMDIANKVGKGEKDILAKYHLQHYKEGEIGGQIFAMWVPKKYEDAADYFIESDATSQELMMRMLARCFKEFRDYDTVKIAYNAEDIERIYESGQIPVLLGFEGFYGFDGELGMIDVMYDLGFRHGMLTWNDDNEFASGVEFTDEDKGLSPLGVETIKRMESLGMLIDVSHASQKTFWDIMDVTTGPIIASHSNAWALCNAPRNLRDEQIRAIAERGGVIGMNGWKGFICEDMETATVHDLARHARYIADLVGPEYVACGFDFSNYFDPTEGTPGIENAGKSQNFVQALFDVGFSEKEVQAIAWDNALRVIKKVLG